MSVLFRVVCPDCEEHNGTGLGPWLRRSGSVSLEDVDAWWDFLEKHEWHMLELRRERGAEVVANLRRALGQTTARGEDF